MMLSSDPPPSYPFASNSSIDASLPQDRKTLIESAANDLDRRVVIYNEARTRAHAEPSNAEAQQSYARAAEGVADGMRAAADAHPDAQTSRMFRRRAEAFVGGSERERENALRDVGKGLLAIIVTPFVLAGLVLYATGTIVGGVGSLLKGMGKFGVVALRKAKQNGF